MAYKLNYLLGQVRIACKNVENRLAASQVRIKSRNTYWKKLLLKVFN